MHSFQRAYPDNVHPLENPILVFDMLAIDDFGLGVRLRDGAGGGEVPCDYGRRGGDVVERVDDFGTGFVACYVFVLSN